MADRYNIRGVSSKKEDVHNAIKGLDKGVYPGAFCKIIGDILSGDDNRVLLLHSDTAGTKPSIAYLYWKETGDVSVFRGIAQDAIVMNTDDLLCTGVYTDFILSSTIGRNKLLIPGEVVKEIIDGTQEFIDRIHAYGITIISAGGETADVGDIIRTLDVGFTVCAAGNKSSIIDTSNITPGLAIVGISSSGKAKYEDTYNSGISSNGLTSAKHDLLSGFYREKNPESYDNNIDPSYVFTGKYRMTDPYEHGIDIGKAILSPTRTFLPVIKSVFENITGRIHGIIHCTGGGQTKCLKFGSNIHYIKDALFDPPKIFTLLAEKTDMREMFRVYNMGHRLELYIKEQHADEIVALCNDFDIDARIIGHTEASKGGNRLTIKHKDRTYTYDTA
ncbi:AIR synthase related protein [Spirochaetota bacterium]